MSDENKNTTNTQPDNLNRPKMPFKDPSFLIGIISGVLVLVLGLVIANKLTSTQYQVDVSYEGFRLGLIMIANYVGAYAPILGIVALVFNCIGLKIQTKFLKIFNYAIIAIAFLEFLLLFNI